MVSLQEMNVNLYDTPKMCVCVCEGDREGKKIQTRTEKRLLLSRFPKPQLHRQEPREQKSLTARDVGRGGNNTLVFQGGPTLRCICHKSHHCLSTVRRASSRPSCFRNRRRTGHAWDFPPEPTHKGQNSVCLQAVSAPTGAHSKPLE